MKGIRNVDVYQMFVVELAKVVRVVPADALMELHL